LISENELGGSWFSFFSIDSAKLVIRRYWINIEYATASVTKVLQDCDGSPWLKDLLVLTRVRLNVDLLTKRA
jgi:hypothetical protein